LFKHVILLK